MSRETVQFLQVAVVSGFFAIGIFRLMKRNALSFRYALGWLILSGIGVLAAAAVPLVGPISESLQISEIALVAAAAVVMLLIVCIQLSISISGLQRQVSILTEEVALLKHQCEG